MLIGGFQPFTLSDYPGKSAAIVFTQGCNFCCPYCHNRSLWPLTTIDPPTHTTDTILAFMARRKGLLGGVVMTGGEPTLQPDLPDFFRKIKKMGFAVKLDTNGSRPDIISGLLEDALIDYIAMDVKAPLEKYHLLCGLPVDTGAICQSIAIVSASKAPHYFRTTLFPPQLTENDLAAVKTLLPPHAQHVTQAFREPSGILHDAGATKTVPTPGSVNAG
jgi:pyruvate formate lyase activating enzyme